MAMADPPATGAGAPSQHLGPNDRWHFRCPCWKASFMAMRAPGPGHLHLWLGLGYVPWWFGPAAFASVAWAATSASEAALLDAWIKAPVWRPGVRSLAAVCVTADDVVNGCVKPSMVRWALGLC